MNSSRKKLTVIGLNYSPEHTGIAPYTSALAQGLDPEKFEVSVLTGFAHYPEWKFAERSIPWSRIDNVDGVPVRRLRHYLPNPPKGLRRLLSEISFGFRAAFSRWRSPDILLLVSPALFSSLIVSLRPCIGARRVIWVQDLYSLGVKELGQGGTLIEALMNAVERFVINRSDTVVVIHELFKDHLVQRLGIPANKVQIIKNWSHVQANEPLESGSRQTARARLGWADTQTIALHSGNMGVKQGLENLVRAAAHAKESGSTVHFVLCGEGAARVSLQELAESYGEIPLTFAPPVASDEFMELLQCADVLLVNELEGVESMAVPSKLTSYFAASLPVVGATSPNGATAQEIESAGAGVVVPAGSPEELLAAIEDLASQPELCTLYGKSARSYRDTILSQEFALTQFEHALLNTLS